MTHSQSGKGTVRLVHVDTTQLELNQKFELSSAQSPDAGDSRETMYKLESLGQHSQDMEVISGLQI